MIIDKEYRLIDGISFIMGFYNPSPGNPEIKTFEFDDHFLYAIWGDGDKTKTEMDSIERILNDDGEEIGINLWFGENSIYLMKMGEDGEYGESLGSDESEDYDDYLDNSGDFPPY